MGCIMSLGQLTLGGYYAVMEKSLGIVGLRQGDNIKMHLKKICCASRSCLIICFKANIVKPMGSTAKKLPDAAHISKVSPFSVMWSHQDMFM